VARIIVVGGGMIGLATALLLEKQGHEITVLERDPAPPPGTPGGAWADWERAGVMQFRQPHFLHAGGWQLIKSELPDVARALAGADAVPWSPLSLLPPGITDRSPRPGDERLGTMNARRPVLEHAMASAGSGRIDVRRGVLVTGLLSDRPGHVSGVRIQPGAELRADLVIDAAGRRSPLPAWLAAIGAGQPAEENGETGFTYYTRFFRARDGQQPPQLRAAPLTHFDCYSILTLPSHARTWSVTIYITSADKALKALRDEDRWTRLLAAGPLYAHLVDEQDPITGVLPASGITDRRRDLVVDGAPAATGILAVGDSWACTNPSGGRGVTLGLKHAALTAEVVGEHLGDPLALTLAHHRLTAERLLPWYRFTVEADRVRAEQITAVVQGRPQPPAAPPSPELTLLRKMVAGMSHDPDVFRAFLELTGLLATPAEIAARPGMSEHIDEAAAGHRPSTAPGPSRAEVLAMLTP
jgi:2-polyprenyl-6-methoxyphenol hydroxylase-like FAD-dependent oxidoreductase